MIGKQHGRSGAGAERKPAPPNLRGQGRKSVQGAGKSPVLQLVVSQELKDKVMRNGPDWARNALTKAKETLP